MKDLINQAYQMGKKAFGVFNIPNDDKEFMRLLIAHTSGYLTDNKKMKLKMEMYKAYKEGCTKEYLNSW